MAKKRILYSNFNYQKKVESVSLISKVPPLDLMYCNQISKKYLDSYILDTNNLELDVEEQIRIINNFNPDLVVFSFEVYSVNDALKVVTRLNTKNKITILMGMFPTTNPLFCLKKIKPDFVILGEPEERIEFLIKNYAQANNLNLLKSRIENEIKAGKIDGFAFKKDRKIVLSKARRFIKNLDLLPIPSRDFARNNLFGKYVYANPFSEKITVIKAQRGCPYNCVYCDAHNLYGRKPRIRSVKNVIKEIELCAEQDIKFISFIDHTFTVNRNWCKDFCEEIIKKGLDKKIGWIALTRVNSVDYNLLKLMKRAGCAMLGYGIETSSDIKLNEIKKDINLSMIKRSIGGTIKAGILCMGYFIIGFPHETKKEIEKTKEFINKLDLDFIQLSFATPLPGTEFYDYCKKNKLILTDNFGDYRFLRKTVLKTNINEEGLKELRRDIILQFYLNPKRTLKRTIRILKNRKISKKQIIKTIFKISKNISI